MVHVPAAQLQLALQRMQAILYHHSVDSSDPGPAPMPPVPLATHPLANGTAAALPSILEAAARRGGLKATQQRLQEALALQQSGRRAQSAADRLSASELLPPGALAPIAWDGEAQVKGERRRRQGGAPAFPTVAEVLSQLRTQRPDLFSPQLVSPHLPSLAVSESALGPVPLEAKEREALRAALLDLVPRITGAALGPPLLDALVWMVELGCLPPAQPIRPSLQQGRSSAPDALPALPSAGGARWSRVQAATAYLAEWLGHVVAAPLLAGEAGLLERLDTCFHLLLRPPTQLDATAQALAMLLQASPGPLLAREPHLLAKSPGQLERELEELMDVTQITPTRLVTAILAEPGILAHHHLERLVMRWSHLRACTTPSPAWRRQLGALRGAELAGAVTATHGVLDGLQYMQERGQDQLHTLPEALQMARQGLGRRFRRWRQRHLLRGQWHTLHQEGVGHGSGVAFSTAPVSGAQMARAHISAWMAQAKQAEHAQREAQRLVWLRQQRIRDSLQLALGDFDA